MHACIILLSLYLLIDILSAWWVTFGKNVCHWLCMLQYIGGKSKVNPRRKGTEQIKFCATIKIENQPIFNLKLHALPIRIWLCLIVYVQTDMDFTFLECKRWRNNWFKGLGKVASSSIVRNSTLHYLTIIQPQCRLSGESGYASNSDEGNYKHFYFSLKASDMEPGFM